MMYIKLHRRIKTIIFLMILFFHCADAQQEQLYTQFMFNKMAFNPAYAGNEEVTCASALFREQWVGIAGAPATQLFSINAPLNNRRIGLGINLVRSTIGITEKLTLDAIYAYRIKLATGTFSIGAQASTRRFDMDFTDPRLIAIQGLSQDQAVQVANLSKNVINFGFGVYYNTNTYFIGAAIPRLSKADIDFDDDLDMVFSSEVRHLYVMGGAAFAVSENVTLKPQTLLKLAEGAPFDIDISFMTTYKEKYHTGLTYRAGGNNGGIGESLDVIFGFQLNQQLMLGFAYDYTLSDLNTYSNGSVEMMLHYCFSKRNNQEEIINPRYF